MKPRLDILHLEDDPKDTELVQDRLEAQGVPCRVTRVETEAEFRAAIEAQCHTLILADYTLPSFDGLSALKIAMEKCPQVPFIFLSGTLDEEVAIEALKIGATDYVFKTRLSRLLPSVRRALREGEERVGEAYLAEAQRLSHTGTFGWDCETGEIYWTPETFRIFAVDPGRKPTLDLVLDRTHPEDRPFVRRVVDTAVKERKEFDFEHRLLTPDGAVKHLRVVAHLSPGT